MRRLTYTPKKAALRRKGASSGFTLVEVMMAMSIFLLTLVGFMGISFGTVAMNKQTSLKLMGMKTINYQLNLLNAAAANPGFISLAGNSPQALIMYFSRLRDELASKAGITGFPYRINVDSARGILSYSFMIPEPDSRNYEWYEDAGEMIEHTYPLAQGVISVYLKEAYVPEVFTGWTDVKSGGVEGVTPSFFDMDDNKVGGGDFVDMLDDSSSYLPKRVVRLPVTITVRFYTNADEMAKDVTTDVAGFEYTTYSEDPERAGHASVSLVRDCFIGEGGGFTL